MSAQVAYEFVAKDGRSFVGTVVSRDVQTGNLTVRREADWRVITFSEALLADENLKGLHEAMTKDLIPTIKMDNHGADRDTTTRWKASWGSYDKTLAVKRGFTITLTSTNSFTRQVELLWFWVICHEQPRVRQIISQGSTLGEVGGGKTTTVKTSDSTSRDVLHLELANEHYTDGSDTLDIVIVVRDLDGKVLGVETTSGVAKQHAFDNLPESARKRKLVAGN